MNWNHASFTLDRFENMSKSNVMELKQHYRRIQQLERDEDWENAAIEKNNAKRLVDQLFIGLQQILTLRGNLKPETYELFDARVERIQHHIQSTIRAFDILLQRNNLNSGNGAPSSSKTDNNNTHRGYDSNTGNLFDDCFDADSQRPTRSIYEDQLLVQSKLNPKAEELRLKAEQAKMDAEASEKLAQEIDDLNQIMMDLSHLVHSQHELVDSIEEHVERSNQEIQAGHQNLKKAVASKNAKYPMMAALFGGVAAGGPVGFAAGSAVAGVAAAVGGAFAGLYGGRAIKKQVQKEATKE